MSSEHKDIGTIVTFIVALVLLVWLLTGCCPCRHLTASTQDSLHIAVTERIVEVRDTAYFEVEKNSQAVTTQDTTSFLENAYAVSRASIVNGGLYHDLSTKPRLWNIPFTIPTIRRDSTVFRNFYRTEVVEVERELTWWQQTQIGGFWVLAALLGGMVAIRKLNIFRKSIDKSNKMHYLCNISL